MLLSYTQDSDHVNESESDLEGLMLSRLSRNSPTATEKDQAAAQQSVTEEGCLLLTEQSRLLTSRGHTRAHQGTPKPIQAYFIFEL